MKRLSFCFVIVLLLVACGHKEQDLQNCFFQGKDSYKRDVVIRQEPHRIVSLSPAITEISFLLHAEDKLVGISDFCTYPAETSKIPKVGKLLNINVESILSLHPDLILISSVVSKKDVEKLERAQVPVFAVKEETKIENLFQTIQTIGKLLNKQSEADSLTAQYRQRIQNMANPEMTARPSVYYVVGFGKTGDFTAPVNSFIHDIISLAGGENIGKELNTWSISREHLFQKNPDYIFIREEDWEVFCRTYPYTELSAVKNHRVYPINSGWIDILSPRNFEAIDYIHKIINS